VFALLAECGGIEDVELRLNWDAATHTHEATAPAAFLSHFGIGRGSVVDIAQPAPLTFSLIYLLLGPLGRPRRASMSALHQKSFRTLSASQTPLAAGEEHGSGQRAGRRRASYSQQAFLLLASISMRVTRLTSRELYHDSARPY
jgi:hypothetical protein